MMLATIEPGPWAAHSDLRTFECPSVIKYTQNNGRRSVEVRQGDRAGRTVTSSRQSKSASVLNFKARNRTETFAREARYFPHGVQGYRVSSRPNSQPNRVEMDRASGRWSDQNRHVFHGAIRDFRRHKRDREGLERAT